MRSPLVLTIIGDDRPGLVELLARTVSNHQGNWLESQMSHLGGQFAGILRLDVPPDDQADLVQALTNLDQQGLTIVVHQDPNPGSESGRSSAVLELVGQDRPGIVRHISHTLARHGVNVEELQTECSSAPMSGETLFRARIRMNIPSCTDATALRQDLEKIAADFMADLNLSPLS